MPENIFTTKLYEVVLPPEGEPLDRVWLVMEYVPHTLKSVLEAGTEVN